MISKPQGDWTREDRTVRAARQFGGVASKALSAGTSGIARFRALYRAGIFASMACVLGIAALAAGLHDGRVLASIGAGCGSLGLGWLALRNVRMALGRERAGGGGPDRGQDTGALGWRHAASGSEGVAQYAGISAPRGGLAIRYSRAKLLIQAAKIAAACVLLACVLTVDRHLSLFLRSLILVVLGAGLWRITGVLLRATDKDLTAISWDSQQISVRSLTASCQVPWQSVESVKSIRRTTRLWRIIPVSTTHEVLFRLRHNGSRRTMSVPASALEICAGDAEVLLRAASLWRAQLAGNEAMAGQMPGRFGRRLAT